MWPLRRIGRSKRPDARSVRLSRAVLVQFVRYTGTNAALLWSAWPSFVVFSSFCRFLSCFLQALHKRRICRPIAHEPRRFCQLKSPLSRTTTYGTWIYGAVPRIWAQYKWMDGFGGRCNNSIMTSALDFFDAPGPIAIGQRASSGRAAFKTQPCRLHGLQRL